MTLSTPKLVVISGNTHRPSKSHALAAFLAQEVSARTGIAHAHFDLIDAGQGLGTAYSRGHASAETEAVLQAIETANALIVSTPVYKGSYPGLFKHLVDLIDTGALSDRPILLAATGGGHRHALVVEHQLRPLFGFFSAQVAPTTIYASESEFVDGRPGEPALLSRIAQAAEQFGRMIIKQSYHMKVASENERLLQLSA